MRITFRRHPTPGTLTGVESDAFTTFEAAGWERQAAGYGRLISRITARVPLPAEGRTLDVGCGDRPRGFGLDGSAAMLRQARTRNPDAPLVAGHADRLPFRDGVFDTVVAGFLLPHLLEPGRAVAEFHRVLRPGGRLAVATWDTPDRARLIGVLIDAIVAAQAPPPDLPPGPPFFRYADPEALAGLLAGFRRVRVARVAFDHPVADTGEWWDGLRDGTVRSAALITDPVPIRVEFDRLAEPYRCRIPVSVVVATAQRFQN
jgi:SAM-dependent methyltransferase